MDRRDDVERLAAIETALNGKGGILDRLQHLDDCVDSLKKTVWKAMGAIMVVSALFQFFFHHS